MSFFSIIKSLIAKVGIVQPPPVPAPVPEPLPPVPAATPPAPTGTTIAMRGNFSGVYYAQDVPLKSTSPIASSKVGKRDWKVEVTVLSGLLTVTDLVTMGNHNPRFGGVVERRYLAGESFIASLKLGPLTSNPTGRYTYAYWGIHTAELGEIVGIQAQVTHS